MAWLAALLTAVAEHAAAQVLTVYPLSASTDVPGLPKLPQPAGSCHITPRYIDTRWHSRGGYGAWAYQRVHSVCCSGAAPGRGRNDRSRQTHAPTPIIIIVVVNIVIIVIIVIIIIIIVVVVIIVIIIIVIIIIIIIIVIIIVIIIIISREDAQAAADGRCHLPLPQRRQLQLAVDKVLGETLEPRRHDRHRGGTCICAR
eukprot:COSAG01_NODE_4977_length_4575_cov_6.431635_2_plen_200_part_00